MKKFPLAVLSALIFTVSASQAAGFGRLTVLSSLGQPFRAEIELNSTQNEDDGNLSVKLASVAQYKRAGVEMSPSLLNMQFSLEQRNGQRYVRVTSSQPVNDPYIDMMIELGGTKSRVLRQYTVLLEPSGLTQQQGPTVASGAPALSPRAVPLNQNYASPVQSSPRGRPLTSNDPIVQEALEMQRRNRQPESVAAAPRSPAAGAEAPAALQRASGSSLSAADRIRTDTVHTGESLRVVATRNLSQGISLDQMLVALFHANKESFIDNNMNRVRAGTVLTVPVASVVKEISVANARREILAQTRDFNSYRNALASKAAGQDVAPEAPAQQTGAGRIGAVVKDSANGAQPPSDQLKLSRGNIAGNDTGAAAANSAGGGKAADPAALQKSNEELKKVLEVQNQYLDKVQKQADTGKAMPAPAPGTIPPPASTIQSSADPGQAPASGAPAVPPGTKPNISMPVAEAVPGSAPNATGGAVVTAPETAGAAGAGPVEQTAPAVPKPVGQPKPDPLPASAPASNFFSGNPLLLPLAGLLVVLVAVVALLRRRKKKQVDQESFFSSQFADSTSQNTRAQGTNSMFAATAAEDVDTRNSMFNSSFVPNLNHIDTNVDPVAEADVYIAYGRDAQAEEILKEALRSQPNRHAIRLKLLEIYAMRRDLRAFEVLAGELYSLTQGAGEEWLSAASMGASIDPDNPLYIGAQESQEGQQDQGNRYVDQHYAAEDTTAPQDSNLATDTQPFAQRVPPTPTQIDPVFEEDELVRETDPGGHPTVFSPTQPGNLVDFNLDEPVKSQTSQSGEKLSAANLNERDAAHSIDFELDEQDMRAINDTQPSDEDAEIETKLDLASAYQEIGDFEGARELLNEIMRSGSPKHVAVANEMLARLG